MSRASTFPLQPPIAVKPLTARLALAALLAAAVAIPTGCLSQQSADPARAMRATDCAPLSPSVWPARDSESALAEMRAIGTTVRLCRRVVVRKDQDLVSKDVFCETPVIGRHAASMGYVLEIQSNTPTVAATSSELPAAAGHLVFVSHPFIPPGHAASGAPDSSTVGGMTTIGHRGIHFDIFKPLTPAGMQSDRAPTGLIVQFHGLGGSEYEQGTIDALRRRGMMVIASDFPWNRWRSTVEEISTQADLLRVAEDLAACSDDCLAEAAYATEAAVDYLRSTRADLADRPVVIMGFSAGALAAPTVAARLIARPESRLSSMVLVGSGSNIIRIAQESDLTNGGVMVLQFGKRISGAMAGLLAGSYIERSKLDPYHVATALRRLPILMVQGASDTIVPANSGAELHERLGNPDLWQTLGGHRALFMQLDNHADSICEWVIKAASVPETPGARPTSADGS